MLKIRLFEEEASKAYMNGEIPGFIHMYIGEEAIAAGVCFNLEKDDYITSTHRGHGHCIAKGMRLDKMMAELFARETGYCKGRGGSMHIADFNHGVLGANGIVGAGMPIAVGAGLAIKLRKKKNIVVTFFGDGATNQGTFHESLNLAALWDLPIIFVCENNQYALSTNIKYQKRNRNISSFGIAYGIPGITVDGNDVIKVYQIANKAIKEARQGMGPSLIVCETYRHMGHCIGDPADYRPKSEEEEWRKKDPIVKFGNYLLEKGLIDNDFEKKSRKKILDEIIGAVEYARSSPHPKPEDALKYVYFEKRDDKE